MSRILVTGATCPLGSALCRRLVDDGHQVVGVGRRVAAFPHLPPEHFTSVMIDLTAALSVEPWLTGCDGVIHAAALASPWAPPAELARTNVTATAALLDAARRAGVRRFVHISSASVTFCGTHALDVREDAPFPQRWLCAYSASKAAAETIVRAASGIETAILRPRALYGPGDRTLLPRLLARAKRGRLHRIGRRDVQQSLTYIDNAVEACVLALNGPSGRTWNVADDEPIALWQTIDRVLQGCGLPPAGRPVSATAVRLLAGASEALHRLLPVLGEPPLTRYTAALLSCDQTLDLTAIRRDLGYRAVVPGALALQRTIASLSSENHGAEAACST